MNGSIIFFEAASRYRRTGYGVYRIGLIADLGKLARKAAY